MFVDGIYQREDRHASRPLIRIFGIGSGGKTFGYLQPRADMYMAPKNAQRKRERTDEDIHEAVDD